MTEPIMIWLGYYIDVVFTSYLTWVKKMLFVLDKYFCYLQVLTSRLIGIRFVLRIYLILIHITVTSFSCQYI